MAPASPKFLGPYLCGNGLTYSDKFWYGNTHGGEFPGGHPGSGNECLLQAGAADYMTTHSSASIQASQRLLLLFPNFHQQSNMHPQVYSATSMAAEVIYHLTSA